MNKCLLCEQIMQDDKAPEEGWNAHVILLAIKLMAYEQGSQNKAKTTEEELQNFINKYLLVINHEQFLILMDNPSKFYNHV